MQAVGKAIDDKVDASEYFAKLNSGKIDTTEKKKLKKSTTTKDDKAKTSKIKSKDDSNTKASKIKKNNESPRNKIKASTPKDSSRSKIKSDKSNIGNSEKKNVIEEEKVSEISKKVVEIEDATPKGNMTNIMTDGSHYTDKDINQDNITNDQIKVQNQQSNRDHMRPHDKAENSTNVSNATVNPGIPKKEQENISKENVEGKEIKTESQSLIRPKSARIKNDESSSSMKEKNIKKEEALKPLEISGKY